MNFLSPLWFEIFSELLINIAAGWFAVVFIEPNIVNVSPIEIIVVLTYRFSLGILSLIAAKKFREEARKQ